MYCVLYCSLQFRNQYDNDVTIWSPQVTHPTSTGLVESHARTVIAFKVIFLFLFLASTIWNVITLPRLVTNYVIVVGPGVFEDPFMYEANSYR